VDHSVAGKHWRVDVVSYNGKCSVLDDSLPSYVVPAASMVRDPKGIVRYGE
jgi:hypothetical protein